MCFYYSLAAYLFFSFVVSFFRSFFFLNKRERKREREATWDFWDIVGWMDGLDGWMDGLGGWMIREIDTYLGR